MIGPAGAAGFEASVVIAISDRQLREAAYEALCGSATLLLADLSDFRDLTELVMETAKARPHILLLGVSGLNGDVMDVIRRIRAIDGGPRVIAMGASAVPQDIMDSMRAGASEFLYPPFGAQFEETLLRVAADCIRDGAGERSTGVVFGMVSAKGGCGATTLACHAAAFLHRTANKRVLLADLDFCSSAAALAMHAKPRYDVSEAVSNLHRLDPTLWKALAVTTACGVDLIPAPEQPMDPMPHLRAIQKLLGFWRSQYDFTVLDLGRGLTPFIGGLLDAMDSIVVIATEEPAALRLAGRIIRTAFSGERRPTLRLVLNRVPRRSSMPPAELERIMDHPFFATISEDRAVLDHALAQGRMAEPASSWGAQVTAFACRLAGLPHEVKKSRRIPFFNLGNRHGHSVQLT